MAAQADAGENGIKNYRDNFTYALAPGLMRRAMDLYSSRYGVDTVEMIVPAEGFRTFNGFFTRKLKKGARKIEKDRRAVVSPVDGRD